MSQLALEKLKQSFANDIIETHQHRGDETAIVRPERIRDICKWLRDTPGMEFNLLIDMTAVDYLDRDPRFEVVYHFYSLKHRHRLRVKAGVTGEDPRIDTICDVWKVADWLEREIWDMYGIRFNGHPDLRRILMYEEFVGHPLRKDYPKTQRQPLSRRPGEEIAQAMQQRGKRSISGLEVQE